LLRALEATKKKRGSKESTVVPDKGYANQKKDRESQERARRGERGKEQKSQNTRKVQGGFQRLQ
jgi:hypothetical protein